MLIGIFVLALVVTGFLTWLFWHYDLDGAFIAAICVLVLELVVGGACAPAYLLGDYACSKVAQKMEVEHDYDFVTGCFIRDEGGRWVNYDKLRSLR